MSFPNNKQIAKNTIFLYIRMLFVMGVSLFTSRVVLNTLGVEDYGIKDVAGGVVSMFAFINSAMASSTQRYLTISIGQKDYEGLKSVFSTSLQIHAVIALVIVVLGETVGLWFLLEKLVIPEERMNAAMWVYQCSIVSSAVGILSVPYNAAIIAHEKMSAFAYISVFEVLAKLFIVYALFVSPWDKLKTYAVLLLLVHVVVRIIYSSYCARHFEETKYNHKVNKPLLKEMSGFAGWIFFGNFSVILYTQGINMMLNIFFGPVVNAARGIAVQVQGAVRQFVRGFQMALNPQITKTYAQGELEQMHTLMFRSARFSFFLLFFLCLPILFETPWILQLWLKTVPEDSVVFTRLMLAISLIYTTINPCVIANQATGDVKRYQIVVGGILLCVVPISYVLLSMGAPAYSVFVVHLCLEVVAQLARMMMLRDRIHVRLRDYLKNIYIPIFLVIVLSILLPSLAYMNMEEGVERFVSVGCFSVVSVLLSVYYIGLSRQERIFAVEKVKQLIRRL